MSSDHAVTLPPRLTPGALVALLSPASTPAQDQGVGQAQESLEGLGFRVSVGAHARTVHGYLAGTDDERMADLRMALEHPDVQGIFCTRGGYGCLRLLPMLPNPKAVLPKVIVGFSDLTTLHLFFQKHGYPTFWGPMPGTGFGLSPFSAQWLQAAVMSDRPLGILPVSIQPDQDAMHPGEGEGTLTGGTLSLMAASLGSTHEIETRGRIVFIEDTGEEPYKLDRMLTQLLNAGKLSDAAGLVFGIFTDCGPVTYDAAHSFTVAQVLHDRLDSLGLPYFTGLRMGHVRDQVTLPYGVRARMDAAARILEVLDPAVR